MLTVSTSTTSIQERRAGSVSPRCNCCLLPLTFCLIALTFAACSTNKHNAEERYQAGIESTSWLIAQHGVVRTGELTRLIDRVRGRLCFALYDAALETELSRDQLAEFKEQFSQHSTNLTASWPIFVLNTPEQNALSTGIGTIFLTKGLLKRVRSETELAAIVAHEMAHHLLGHTAAVFETAGTANASPVFSFSLEQELAADQLSIRLLKSARYDTRGALMAITNIYRENEREVSGIDPQHYMLRLAHMKQTIDRIGLCFPAAEDSRLFSQARGSFS